MSFLARKHVIITRKLYLSLSELQSYKVKIEDLGWS